MDCRDVLKYIVYLIGYVVIVFLSSVILSGCILELIVFLYVLVFFIEEEFGGISVLVEVMFFKISILGVGEVGVFVFVDVVFGKYIEVEDQQCICIGLNFWLSGVVIVVGKVYMELVVEE